MRKSRKQARSIYEGRYKSLHGERVAEYWLCVYCGDPADTVEHVPPLSRVSDYEALGIVNELYCKSPACRECNSVAGDSLQDSFMARVEYVKDCLERRYRRYLRLPEWDDAELDEAEFGPVLRSAIVEHNRKAKAARERIEYFAGVDEVLWQIELGAL